MIPQISDEMMLCRVSQQYLRESAHSLILIESNGLDDGICITKNASRSDPTARFCPLGLSCSAGVALTMERV